MTKRLWLFFLLVLSQTLWAGPSGILSLQTPLQLDDAYDRVYKALEAERFWVVFEADMGKRMARFNEEWGSDYNRNDLQGVRAMVFCNIEWTNRVGNADPDLLGLCPLHLTLYSQAGKTHVLIPRLSVLARGSDGAITANELEAVIRGIVEDALAD
jgi:uncharacterized protein (DUF302 family)